MEILYNPMANAKGKNKNAFGPVGFLPSLSLIIQIRDKSIKLTQEGKFWKLFGSSVLDYPYYLIEWVICLFVCLFVIHTLIHETRGLQATEKWVTQLGSKLLIVL